MWLYLPTSVCSPEPPGSISDYESLSRRLAVSATWNGKEQQPPSWLRELKKGRLTRRLSGLTCEPSRADSIVAAWLESSAGSPVRISRLQESGPESTAPDPDCGPNTRGSLGTFDPTGYSLRTSQVSLITNQCDEFSETFPASGSMRNGSVFERPTWAPRTAASGCSFWPTAVAHDDQKTPEAHLAMKQRMGERDGTHANRTAITSLNVFVQQWGRDWPTPQVHDSGGMRGNTMADHHYFPHDLVNAVDQWRTPDAPGSGGPRNRQGSQGAGHQITIAEQAEHWATPNVPNGGRVLSPKDVEARGATDKGKRQVGLEMETAYWRTPQACSPNSMRGSGQDPAIRAAQGHAINLQDQVSTWRTPNTRDHHAGGPRLEAAQRQIGLVDQVNSWASSPSDLPTRDGKLCWCNTPGCAPSLSQAEAESHLRDVADGMASLVVSGRTAALRALGNGVVPLQAAAGICRACSISRIRETEIHTRMGHTRMKPEQEREQRFTTEPTLQIMSTPALQRTLELVVRKPIRRAGMQDVIEKALVDELERRKAA